MSPTQFAITVVAVLVAGFIVGAVTIAISARSRQLDEQVAASRAFRDLVAVAERYSSPEHRAALRRAAADLWDSFDPFARHLAVAMADAPGQAGQNRTPDYVHRLIDAYATGDPIDFQGCPVPPDVRGRLRAVMAGASEATTRLPDLMTWRPGSIAALPDFTPHRHPAGAVVLPTARRGESDG